MVSVMDASRKRRGTPRARARDWVTAGMLDLLFPDAVEEIDRSAEQDQKQSKGAIQQGRFSTCRRRPIAGEVVVDGEDKIERGKEDEEPGHDWIARNLVRTRGARLLAAQHKNSE